MPFSPAISRIIAKALSRHTALNTSAAIAPLRIGEDGDVAEARTAASTSMP